jgi:hypothetical protein
MDGKITSRGQEWRRRSTSLDHECRIKGAKVDLKLEDRRFDINGFVWMSSKKEVRVLEFSGTRILQ